MREYRTNPKIARSNRELSRMLAAAGFEIFDTYAMLAPIYDMPCDTHHYLCSDRGRKDGYGMYDLQAFLHFVCVHPS